MIATEQKEDGMTQPATMTVEEAGRTLGIGRALAYELARRGEIPVVRLGRRLVVPRAQLQRLLEGEPERPAAA